MWTREQASALVVVGAFLVAASCSSEDAAPASTRPVTETIDPAPPSTPRPERPQTTPVWDGAPAANTRDPLRWPYPWDSIWNHPSPSVSAYCARHPLPVAGTVHRVLAAGYSHTMPRVRHALIVLVTVRPLGPRKTS